MTHSSQGMIFALSSYLFCVGISLKAMSVPIITIDQGKILGKFSKNANNKPFFSFQGIPYATPPLGQLRFKAPRPAGPWFGTFDATKEGTQCFCRDHLCKSKISGSDDCLFINIYTKNLQSEKVALKPVMVFIHGGGFNLGSSKTDLYGPEFLMTQDIVLVTFNYRVGIFGFLNFKDPTLGVTGNAGLKDQVLALKWVQKNIRKFGGDLENVTIFGQSAGGACVHYLVLSPLTKGLFHRAIAQSGLALHAFAKGRYNNGLEIAEELNLKTTNESEILDYLMKLSVKELHSLSEKLPDTSGIDQFRAFGPVIEPKTENALITDDPLKIIKSRQYNHVPLIIGYTSREGMMLELSGMSNYLRIPENYEDAVPLILGLERGSNESKDVADKIIKFYFGSGDESLNNHFMYASDTYFLRETIFGARLHAATSKSQVYLYRISVESDLNLFKKVAHITQPGVCHGDDLGYLFKTAMTPVIKKGSREDITIKRILKLWTNFARFGNPNSKERDSIEIKWKPIEENEVNFLDIGETLSVDINPEAERIAFWDEILKTNHLYCMLFDKNK